MHSITRYILSMCIIMKDGVVGRYHNRCDARFSQYEQPNV